MFEYRLSSAAAEGGPKEPRAGRRISSVMPAAKITRELSHEPAFEDSLSIGTAK